MGAKTSKDVEGRKKQDHDERDTEKAVPVC